MFIACMFVFRTGGFTLQIALIEYGVNKKSNNTMSIEEIFKTHYTISFYTAL